MYINQQDAQNSCDYTLFSITALHVSDCISPSSGASSHKLYNVLDIGMFVQASLAVAPHTKKNYLEL